MATHHKFVAIFIYRICCVNTKSAGLEYRFLDCLT